MKNSVFQYRVEQHRAAAIQLLEQAIRDVGRAEVHDLPSIESLLFNVSKQVHAMGRQQFAAAALGHE